MNRTAKIARFALLAKEHERLKSRLHLTRSGSDHAWRLMLELYIALGGGYRLLTTRLWAETGMNSTTGARNLDFLVEQGWATKTPVAGHNTATYVGLTKNGIQLLETHLEQIFDNASKIDESGG